MDYASKISIVFQLQFLDLIESFQMKYREINPTNYEDEQQEEEEFFSQVADAVFRLGQWSQELYSN
jgi:hypothetical protein